MSSCCGTKKNRPDWLLIISGGLVLLGYGLSYALPAFLPLFTSGIQELLHQMWFGIILGIIFVGIVHGLPQRLILALLGDGAGLRGLIRASVAGVVLDLCSHGILMVASKLYQKGVSTPQVMAFLIASPWNSLSLMVILASLIGVWWMLTFLVLSVVLATTTGLLFAWLERRGTISKNPHHAGEAVGTVRAEWGAFWAQRKLSRQSVLELLKNGLIGSKIVIKWLLVGVVLAAAIRAMMPAELFATWFGPTVIGLLATSAFATVIEVCSEGTVPVASDIFHSAAAPGNSFAFLMTGVATDYTEVMVLRETTKSWRIALLLPILVFPQVFIIALILNIS